MSAIPTKEGLMRWVDETAAAMDLGPCEALVLTKFAAYADAACRAWAAVKTLARQGRCSERKVQYVLRDFEAAGLIARTGDLHRLPDTTRDVPIYVFSGFLSALETETGDHGSMGARRAPIDAEPGGYGCTEPGGMGAQGVHPHMSPLSPSSLSSSDEAESERRARDVAFERLEGAYPKRGLAFTNRRRAIEAFEAVADRGIDLEKLIGAAKAWAADPKGRKGELGLDYWLVDARYRGTWPEAQLFDDAPKSPAGAAHPGAAAWEDQQLWAAVERRLGLALNESEFGSYVRPAFLGERGGLLFVVALTGVARDWIARSCWRRVAAWWAETDPGKRPIALVSKAEFEAALSREGGGREGGGREGGAGMGEA